MLRSFSSLKRLSTLLSSGQSALASVKCKHTLPDLPYDFGALEPHISAQIMEVHYTKHHQTYVNNLNDVEEKMAQAHAKGDVKTMIALTPALRFNGGGHINHSIFWQNLAPSGGEGPSDTLKKCIERDFGSFDKLKEQLSASTVAVQGSGWGWLAYNKTSKRLQLATCPNQDPLEATTGLIPLFGIDVWEHAYYLQYKNVRPDYVKAIWHIANWKDISRRFKEASS